MFNILQYHLFQKLNDQTNYQRNQSTKKNNIPLKEIIKDFLKLMQKKLSDFIQQEKHQQKLPPGLTIQTDFITEEQQNIVLIKLKEQPWSDDLKRKTLQYGFKYDYQTRQLIELQKSIPSWIRMGLSQQFDQLIVNNYEKGEGISKHTDHKTNFHNEIAIVSLLSNCEMTFRKGKQESITVTLPRRSKIVLKDEVRYDWTHEISRVKQKRISLTFRKVWKDKVKK